MDNPQSLQGKKILLGVTGSIAAYKAVMLCRLLQDRGAVVRVIMTPSAQEFVTPLTFSTLSGNEVISSIWKDGKWENHVELGLWADLMVIAPCTANTMASLAQGLCNNALLAVYLSARCPVMISPAMDVDMWHHPATQSNIDLLASRGNQILQVGYGKLASGLIGEGRMMEPADICDEIETKLTADKALKGYQVIVSAGPTYEKIDPVRYLGNWSSGKMGIAVADAFYDQGAEVILVCGPTHENLDKPYDVKRITSADELYNEVTDLWPSSDVCVMAAAVADYTPEHYSEKKVKKSDDDLSISLIRTKDIAKSLGENKKEGQILVGFALETNNEEQNALAKLKKKNLDFIVLNSLNDDGAGFKGDTNKVTIIDKNGEQTDFPVKPKNEVAKDIVTKTRQFLKPTT